jgi:hypothetical protein
VEFDDEPSIVDENGNDAVLTAYRSFVETMTGDEQSSEDENTAVPAADDNNDDTEIATTTMSLNELDMTNFFETTTNDADEVFIALKELLQSDSYGSIQEARLKLMEYMDLGRLEKGLLHFDTNRKSFQQRWMSIKKRPLKDDPGSSEDDGVFIERDSLISLHCTRGDSVTVEYYMILYPFTKYYNKWYVCVDQSMFSWIKDDTKVRFLVRMMCARGGTYEEVNLEKDCEFGPRSNYRICVVKDIVNVVGSLIDF